MSENNLVASLPTQSSIVLPRHYEGSELPPLSHSRPAASPPSMVTLEMESIEAGDSWVPYNAKDLPTEPRGLSNSPPRLATTTSGLRASCVWLEPAGDYCFGACFHHEQSSRAVTEVGLTLC